MLEFIQIKNNKCSQCGNIYRTTSSDLYYCTTCGQALSVILCAACKQQVEYYCPICNTDKQNIEEDNYGCFPEYRKGHGEILNVVVKPHSCNSTDNDRLESESWHELQERDEDMQNMGINVFNEYVNKFEQSELYKYYHQSSFLEEIKKERDEDVHSSFLACVFSKYKDSDTLRNFLKIIKQRAESQDKMDMLPEIPIEDNIDIVNVIQEDAFKGENKNGRIDLILECNNNVMIFIENKVCSHEHFNKASNQGQTNAYYTHYKNKYPKALKIFVFLTPLDSISLDKYDSLNINERCECEKFIQINYQDILDGVLVKLSAFKKKGLSRDKIIIQEYIKTLSIPSPEQTKKKRRITMAVTNELKEASKDFWKKHQELIICSLNAMREDETITDEDRKAFKDFSEFLGRFKANDNTKFHIEGIDGPVNKRNLALKFCEAYLNKYTDRGLADLQKIFEGIRKEFVSDKKFERAEQVQGKEIWVYTNVGSTSSFYEKLVKRLTTNKEIQVCKS